MDGIGPITAITMRAEIARFERFNTGKQLARYCGLTPRNASSRQRQADAGLVKAGNTQLRMVIIQAAQRLINFNPHWNRFACRLMQPVLIFRLFVATLLHSCGSVVHNIKCSCGG